MENLSQEQPLSREKLEQAKAELVKIGEGWRSLKDLLTDSKDLVFALELALSRQLNETSEVDVYATEVVKFINKLEEAAGKTISLANTM